MVCRTKIITPAGNLFDGVLTGIVPASDAIRFEFNDRTEVTIPGEYPDMAQKIRGKGLKGLHSIEHEINFRTGQIVSFKLSKFDPEKAKVDRAIRAAKIAKDKIESDLISSKS